MLLAIALFFIDINPITSDKLLIAIFGGLLMGTGVGLVIRGGGVIDGAEVIAVFHGQKNRVFQQRDYYADQYHHFCGSRPAIWY